MMANYVIFLRGINVAGKNKIKMADLRKMLEEAGFSQVKTYIQSGNVVLESELNTSEVARQIEVLLPERLQLDSSLIRVLAIEASEYRAIVESAPPEFGKDNDTYRYDVYFLLGVTPEEVMAEVAIREGYDTAWPGKQAIFYRRPGSNNPDYTKTYSSKIIRKPIYQAMTARNWRTTLKMLEMVEE